MASKALFIILGEVKSTNCSKLLFVQYTLKIKSLILISNNHVLLSFFKFEIIVHVMQPV